MPGPLISRRTWLQNAAAVVPAWSALRGFQSLATTTPARRDFVAGVGYGPLRPTAAVNTGEVLLALPGGFRYTAFGRTGEPMTDGRPTPPDHDGMAAFQVGNEVRLVRNHEVTRVGTPIAPAGPSYDERATGGTTTLVIGPRTRLPLRSFVSLSGTLTNCAGGPTPWGSWITCEETTHGPAKEFAQPHGYCFEVPAAADGPVTPVPLKAMGRFVHEAIAVDPESGIVYLTEDNDGHVSGFYRFLPNEPGRLAAGGRLQMLTVKGQPNYETRAWQRPNRALRVGWIDIPDPDPNDLDLPRDAIFAQGATRGGAVFARLEGAWYGGGRIYFDSTTGGGLRKGQIWEYRPDPDGGELRMIYESTDPAVLNNLDNLCLSPCGKGLVVCEDTSAVQYVRGLTVDGQIFDLARNMVPDHENDEFAGATFSPDGETRFINVQRPGITLAIWGDWAVGAL